MVFDCQAALKTYPNSSIKIENEKSYKEFWQKQQRNAIIMYR